VTVRGWPGGEGFIQVPLFVKFSHFAKYGELQLGSDVWFRPIHLRAS